MAQHQQICWQLKLNANPLCFLPLMKEASSYWGRDPLRMGWWVRNDLPEHSRTRELHTLLWGLGLGLQLGCF